ncbi:MAG: InlB B-repeat-containing protein [Coprobacillus sp.]
MMKRVLSILLVMGMVTSILSTVTYAKSTDTVRQSSFGRQVVVYLNSNLGDDSNSGENKDDAVKSFQRAKELLSKDGTILIDSSLTILGDETWNLTGYGNAKVQRSSSLNGAMLIVEDSNSLTLENIVIDGGQRTDATDPIVKSLSGGNLTLKSGAVLQNNYGDSMGAAVSGWDGFQLTIENGASIKNNKTDGAHYGGGVFLANNSRLTMNGGKISENIGNRGGGIALICSHMIMNGGSIENNQSYNISNKKKDGYGGGIYIADYENISGTSATNAITRGPASLYMSGGKITGNTGDAYGGGICTFPQAGNGSPDISITVDGGTISNNETGGSGSGIAMFFNSTKFKMISGIISNNKATAYGGGLYLYSVNDAVMSGGIITNNQANVHGGGIELYRDSASTMKTMGSAKISMNTAPKGAGVYIGNANTYTAIEKSTIINNNLTYDKTETKGDGVYVGGMFKIGDKVDIDPSNDVYLPSGKYIQVISPFDGASVDHQVQITSEEKDIENISAIGTKLVDYESSAGGKEAALSADKERLYVPSAKMPEGLAIGNSKIESDWMTYVDGVSIEYKWVGNEYPTDVQPPQTDKIRLGNQYNARNQLNTKQNFVFTGWYTEETCLNKFVDGTILHDNIVLYGKWTENYTVTYEGNGGIGDVIDSQSPYEKDDTVVVLGNKFTNGSKEFIGWNTQADGSGTSYKAGDTFIMPTMNVILYAQWKSIDIDDGESEDYTTLTVNKVWENDKVDNRPKSVTVQLYKDGKIYGDTIELNEKNNWKYTWEKLDKGFKWSVDEVLVAEGYEKTVTGKGTSYTIINTWKDKVVIIPTNPKKPIVQDTPSHVAKVPETNDMFLVELWMKTFILLGFGLVIINKRKLYK